MLTPHRRHGIRDRRHDRRSRGAGHPMDHGGAYTVPLSLRTRGSRYARRRAAARRNATTIGGVAPRSAASSNRAAWDAPDPVEVGETYLPHPPQALLSRAMRG